MKAEGMGATEIARALKIERHRTREPGDELPRRLIRSPRRRGQAA